MSCWALNILEFDLNQIEYLQTNQKLQHSTEEEIPNTPYLICYLGEITKTMQKTNPNVAKCPATATLKEGKLNLRKEHNHEPDLRIHDRLSARKKARDGVAKSSQPT